MIPATRTYARAAALCWLIVVVAVLVGMVSVARAAPFTPELEADYAYAEQWWGAVPSGCSSVAREVLPDAAMPGAGGRATQPEPGAEPVPCVMQIAESSLAVTCQRREVVLHEYGHLLGYGHSDDPANIMYPTSLPGFLCEAEFQAKYRLEVETGLHQIEVRCRHKRRRAERKECRRNERYWQRMVREAGI